LGINSIVDTDPWMIPYFQGGYEEAKGYTKGSGKYITPICPDCGRIKNKPMMIATIYIRHSIGCSCGDGQSYPFKFMFNLLEQLNMEFIPEYSPDWIYPKRYDFYFVKSDIKYIVEVDGEFHSKDNSMNGQTKEESKAKDDYKDKLADEHDIEMIRVDSEISELEYIKFNIINSKLSNILDLSKIDWLKCHEFALSNLVKVACDYKKNNPNMFGVEISKLMKLSTTTIYKYLRKGSALNWCNFDKEQEKINKKLKMQKIVGNKVKIFKDGVCLGSFPSLKDLERQSIKTFGIKLLKGAISLVCHNKSKQYKGYTFKFVDNEIINK